MGRLRKYDKEHLLFDNYMFIICASLQGPVPFCSRSTLTRPASMLFLNRLSALPMGRLMAATGTASVTRMFALRDGAPPGARDV